MIDHPLLIFNQNTIVEISLQKHSEMFWDSKLNFIENLKNVFQKTNKTIETLGKTPNSSKQASFNKNL